MKCLKPPIIPARARTSVFSRSSYASLRRYLASTPPPYEQASSSGRTLPFALQTSLVIARAPLLTTLPTTFESEYYEYQSRLHRALSQPFPADFYFKKGTLLERRFNAEERVREKAAFGEGFGVAVEGDERLEDIPSDEEAVTFLPRETEADRSNNFKSINRRGERTLYLLVKPLKSRAASGAWEFPTWEVGTTQPLHTSVREALTASLGPNMNIWMVGRQPIDVLSAAAKQNAKTFFFKARILGGKPEIQSRSFEDFAWLVKEEIEKRVDPSYWMHINSLLPSV